MVGSGGAGSGVRRDMKNDNAMTRNEVTIEPTARKRENILSMGSIVAQPYLAGIGTAASWCKVETGNSI